MRGPITNLKDSKHLAGRENTSTPISETQREPCCPACAFCTLAFIPIIIGVVWFILDMSLAINPEVAFREVYDCLVINVTQEFFQTSSGCFDRFRYEFLPDQFSDSPPIVPQFESVQRVSSQCSDPNLVGLEASRFSVGDTRVCWVL